MVSPGEQTKTAEEKLSKSKTVTKMLKKHLNAKKKLYFYKINFDAKMLKK